MKNLKKKMMILENHLLNQVNKMYWKNKWSVNILHSLHAIKNKSISTKEIQMKRKINHQIQKIHTYKLNLIKIKKWEHALQKCFKVSFLKYRRRKVIQKVDKSSAILISMLKMILENHKILKPKLLSLNVKICRLKISEIS